MAVLASIVADNHHRRDDARRIAEAVAPLEPVTPREELEKWKVNLIFHTAFGDLDEAVTAGRRIVSSERRTGNSAGLLKALRWLSLPLLLTNDIEGSVAVLTEAFGTAERLGLQGEMWNAAFYLSGVALDCEDLPLALKWAPVVADLDDNATIYPLRTLDHRYFEARIEYMRGDFERAGIFLRQSRALKKSIPAARGEQSWLALEVLLHVQKKARSIPRRTLDRLYRLHVRTRDVGTQDFETAAIVAGLLYSGDRHGAQELDSYYARVRRSRIETNRTLRTVREQLASCREGVN